MKPTEKILYASTAAGIAAAGALYYFFPDLHWGWYLGLGVFVAAVINQDTVKQIAAERIVDRDMNPKN